MLLRLWVLSISLSIDALGIGMSYRLKGVRISLFAKLIVGIMVSGVSFAALLIGNRMVAFFPEQSLKIGVTILLCLIGVMFIRKGLKSGKEVLCDIDASSSIEPLEAVLLGIGLSLDSIGTGIAVVALGIHHMLLPILIGINHTVFLLLGEWMAERTMRFAGKSQKICSFCSGILLILLAVLHGIG